MKKIIFFSCALFFSAPLTSADKTQQELFKATNAQLKALANVTLCNGLLKLGRALYYVGQSLQNKDFVIENKNSLAILAHCNVLEGDKVKNDVRDAFNTHGKEEAAYFSSFVTYKIMCDRSEN